MKKIQLILTNPCAKQWADMPASKIGRYCDSCEKHIVDLTDKTDAELIQFFKKKNDNVCGRLLANQLNRALAVPNQKSVWPWLLPFAIGAVAFSPAQASELRPVFHHANTPKSQQLIDLPPQTGTSLKTDTLKGRVVDDKNGAPLKGVKFKQKGFENVIAVTDSTGAFELELSKENANAVFIVELNGYSKLEMPLQDNLVIRMAEVRIVLGGISSIAHHQQPLYILYSGKKSCTIDAEKMKDIPPNWIEKFEVLKDRKATSIYGSKGANGVILIGIKPAYAKQIDFSKKN